MAKVTFILRDNTPMVVDAPIGLSVMEIARKAGINDIEGACGGSLACATCHVVVHPDWYARVLPESGKSMEEEDMLDLAFDLAKTSRLSCQILMRDDLDGLVLALPSAKNPF
jgi:2Fe-2S ferredoxin